MGPTDDRSRKAADCSFELPDLPGVDPDEVGGILLPRFFAVPEGDETIADLSREELTRWARRSFAKLMLGPAP
ncbi:MAG: hypothetical protein WBZ37_28200 [Mycobacterium sp.]